METIYIADNSLTNRPIYYFIGVVRANVNQHITVTEYPTTEGQSISDHAFLNLADISMSLINDHLSSTSNIFNYESTGKIKYLSIDEAKSLIETWKTEHHILTINTREHKIDKAVLSSYSNEENNQNRGTWEPTLGFKEIRISSIQINTQTFSADEETGVSNTDESSSGVDNGVSTILGTIGAYTAAGLAIGVFVPVPGARVVGVAVGAIVGSAIAFHRWLNGE